MTLTVYPQIEQRSDEWHDQRRGMVTASAVGQLVIESAPDPLAYMCRSCGSDAGEPCLSLASVKVPKPLKSPHGGRIPFDAPEVLTVAYNDTSRSLTMLLVSERITGYTEPTFINSDMWRGIEEEPRAVEWYAEHHGVEVETTGFMVNDDSGYSLGYSPDGLVGDDGLLEVKAPRAKGHLATILADEIPRQHVAQCQAGLLVSGREWIDFISFCGGMPPFVKRMTPDPKWHAAILAALEQFELTAAEMVTTYRNATKGLAVTERIPNLDDIRI